MMEILNFEKTCLNILKVNSSSASLPQQYASYFKGLAFPVLSDMEFELINRNIIENSKQIANIFKIDAGLIRYSLDNFERAKSILKTDFIFGCSYILHCFIYMMGNMDFISEAEISAMLQIFPELITKNCKNDTITNSTILSAFYYFIEKLMNNSLNLLPLIIAQIDSMVRCTQNLPSIFFQLVTSIASKIFSNNDETTISDNASIFLNTITALFTNDPSRIPVPIVSTIVVCISQYVDILEPFSLEFIVTCNKYFPNTGITEICKKLPSIFMKNIEKRPLITPYITNYLTDSLKIEKLPEINYQNQKSTFSKAIQIGPIKNRALVKLPDLVARDLIKSISITANLFRSSQGKDYDNEVNNWIKYAKINSENPAIIDFWAVILKMIVTVAEENFPVGIFDSPLFDSKIVSDHFKNYKNIFSLRANAFYALMKSKNPDYDRIFNTFILCASLMDETIFAIHSAIFDLKAPINSLPQLFASLLKAVAKLRGIIDVSNSKTAISAFSVPRKRALELVMMCLQNSKMHDILIQNLEFVKYFSKLGLEEQICPIITNAMKQDIININTDLESNVVLEFISNAKIVVSMERPSISVLHEIMNTVKEVVNIRPDMAQSFRTIFTYTVDQLANQPKRAVEKDTLLQAVGMMVSIPPETGKDLSEAESANLVKWVRKWYVDEPDAFVLNLLIKLAAGSLDVTQTTMFEIVHPRAIEVLITVFARSVQSGYLSDIFSMLRKLVDNNGVNANICLKSHILLTAFELAETWRADPNLEPKIEGTVKPPSYSITNEVFTFFEKLLRHSCTYGIMLRYIRFFCPLDGICLPTYFEIALKTLENIFEFSQKNTPHLAVPLSESTEIIISGLPNSLINEPNSGITIGTWVKGLSLMGTKEASFFKIVSGKQVINFSIKAKKGYISFKNDSVEQIDLPNGLKPNTWTFITLDIIARDDNYSITYRANEMIFTHSFKYFPLSGEPTGTFNVIVSGENSPNLFIGPFCLFRPTDDIKEYIESGPRSPIPNFAITSFTPTLSSNQLCLISPKIEGISIRYKKQPVHTVYSMADIISMHNVNVLIPLLAQVDLKYQNKTGCSPTLFARTLCLISSALSSSLDCQEAFRECFATIAHLFATYEQVRTVKVFNILLQLLDNLSDVKLQTELIDTIILNPSIWLLAKAEVVNTVTEKWATIVAVKYRQIVHELRSFNWIVGVLSVYLYYTKDQNSIERQIVEVDTARKNVCNLAIQILNEPLQESDFECIVALILTNRDQQQQESLLEFLYELLRATKSKYKGLESAMTPIHMLRYILATDNKKAPALALLIFTEMVFTNELNVVDHFEIIHRELDSEFPSQERLEQIVKICEDRVPELLPICCWMASAIDDDEAYKTLLTIKPDKKYCPRKFWAIWPSLVLEAMPREMKKNPNRRVPVLATPPIPSPRASSMKQSQPNPPRAPADKPNPPRAPAGNQIPPRAPVGGKPVPPRAPADKPVPPRISTEKPTLPAEKAIPRPASAEAHQEISLCRKWASFMVHCDPSSWSSMIKSVMVMGVAFEHDSRRHVKMLLEEIAKGIDNEFKDYREEFEKLLMEFLLYHFDEKTYLLRMFESSVFSEKTARTVSARLGARSMSGRLLQSQSLRASAEILSPIIPGIRVSNEVQFKEILYTYKDLETNVDSLIATKEGDPLHCVFGLMLVTGIDVMHKRSYQWSDYEFVKSMLPHLSKKLSDLLQNIINRYENYQHAELIDISLLEPFHNNIDDYSKDLRSYLKDLNEYHIFISEAETKISPIEHLSRAFSQIAPTLYSSFQDVIAISSGKYAKAWSRLWHELSFERAPWNSSLSKRVREERFYKRDNILCNGVPFKMRRNFHYDNHILASALRDTGDVEKSQEKAAEDANRNTKEVSKLLEVQMPSKEETPVINGLEQFHQKLECVIVTASKEVPCTFTFSKRRIIIGRSPQPIAIKFSQINEILLRTVIHRRTAIEIFTYDGKSYFINFPKYDSRAIMKMLSSYVPNHKLQLKTFVQHFNALSITQAWVNGEISNFSYLLQLNKYAGRSFNNTSQYPIFPWVLNNYSAETLNLSDPKSFRDLSRPMGALSEERLSELMENFHELEDSFIDPIDPPYLYSSGPLSSLTIFLYLVRIEPFASLHINMQSGRFDNPARQFRSVGVSFGLSSGNSKNDFSELVPEFYFCSDFLQNMNQFDLGKIDGKSIANVQIPPWASNPMEFIYQHRKALESPYVSQSLNKWIDLVFGKLQRSKEHFNIYKNQLYSDIWENKEAEDNAILIEESCKNLGQIPAPLFENLHPERKPTPQPTSIISESEGERTFSTGSCVVSAVVGLAGKNVVHAIVTLDGRTVINNINMDNIGADKNPQQAPSVDKTTIQMRRKTAMPRSIAVPVQEKHLDFTRSKKPVWCTAPNGIYVASNQRRSVFFISNTGKPKEVHRHKTDITALAASEKYVMVGDADGNATLFNSGMSSIIFTAQSYRERIVCGFVSDEFHAFAAATKDGMLLLCSINTASIYRSIQTTGMPVSVLITPSWGFIAVQSKLESDGGRRELTMYTITGQPLPDKTTPWSKTTAWAAVTDRNGFDHIVFAEDSIAKVLQCFEAFYPENRHLIPCSLDSTVVGLRYSPKTGTLIASTESDGVKIVRFNVNSFI